MTRNGSGLHFGPVWGCPRPAHSSLFSIWQFYLVRQIKLRIQALIHIWVFTKLPVVSLLHYRDNIVGTQKHNLDWVPFVPIFQQGSPVSSKAGKNAFFSTVFSTWKNQFLPVSSAEILKKLKNEVKYSLASRLMITLKSLDTLEFKFKHSFHKLGLNNLIDNSGSIYIVYNSKLFQQYSINIQSVIFHLLLTPPPDFSCRSICHQKEGRKLPWGYH